MSKRWRYYLEFAVTGGLLSTAGLYLVGHLGFGIPLPRLFTPGSAFLILFTCSAPLTYWARNRAIGPHKDARPLFLVIGLILVGGALLLIIYGANLQLLQPATAKGYALACVLTGLPGILIGYYVYKSFSTKIRHR